MATLGGGAWLLFQNQFAGLELQLRTTNQNLSTDIRDNRTELERLRNETIGRREQEEFTKRIDAQLSILRERLLALEATRPTTGELQGTGSALKNEINDVKDRVKFLEQAPRPTQTQQPPLQGQGR